MGTSIFILIILILINAFFAATEIAFISLNDAKIEIQVKEGNKKAKRNSKHRLEKYNKNVLQKFGVCHCIYCIFYFCKFRIL